VSFYLNLFLFERVIVHEVSTMNQNGHNMIIFLINNGGYTIEFKIHDGPYNVIKNWNYTSIVKARMEMFGCKGIFFLYIQTMANNFARAPCFFYGYVNDVTNQCVNGGTIAFIVRNR